MLNYLSNILYYQFWHLVIPSMLKIFFDKKQGQILLIHAFWQLDIL